MKFIIDKDIYDITIEDIYYLVENQIPEGISIDYKLKNYEVNSSGKKELLKDVTSFANFGGGDIIIGIGDDKYNQAKYIVGIDSNNIAVNINRIEQVIHSGIEPKLNTVKVRYIEYFDKYIIIIRIDSSSLFPHMVSFQKINKFYIRKSDKNILLDAYELRNIFLKSENIIQNIKNENKNRILKVYQNNTIIPLNVHKPKIMINFIPYNLIFNIRNLNNISFNFPEQRINFDGILAYKTNQDGIESYCQLYRNGIIEFVSSASFLNIKNPYSNLKSDYINVISGNKNGYEYFIIKKCLYFFNYMKKLKIELPIYIFITIINAKGYRIFYNNSTKENIKLTDSIDRDILELPELEFKNYNIDIKKTIKDVINMIWNSCGVEKSINFDSNGNWLGEKLE